jgi:hypothetical protein
MPVEGLQIAEQLIEYRGLNLLGHEPLGRDIDNRRRGAPDRAGKRT